MLIVKYDNFFPLLYIKIGQTHQDFFPLFSVVLCYLLFTYVQQGRSLDLNLFCRVALFLLSASNLPNKSSNICTWLCSDIYSSYIVICQYYDDPQVLVKIKNTLLWLVATNLLCTCCLLCTPLLLLLSSTPLYSSPLLSSCCFFLLLLLLPYYYCLLLLIVRSAYQVRKILSI